MTDQAYILALPSFLKGSRQLRFDVKCFRPLRKEQAYTRIHSPPVIQNQDIAGLNTCLHPQHFSFLPPTMTERAPSDLYALVDMGRSASSTTFPRSLFLSSTALLLSIAHHPHKLLPNSLQSNPPYLTFFVQSSGIMCHTCVSIRGCFWEQEGLCGVHYLFSPAELWHRAKLLLLPKHITLT